LKGWEREEVDRKFRILKRGSSVVAKRGKDIRRRWGALKKPPVERDPEERKRKPSFGDSQPYGASRRPPYLPSGGDGDYGGPFEGGLQGNKYAKQPTNL